jgi:ATP-dependent DNA helicase RecG
MTAPPADISRLRNVLQRELDRGCDDRLVIGGLDRMLIQMAEDGTLRETPALKQQLLDLGSGGYRALDTPARKKWLASAISGLPGETRSPRDAPVRAGGPRPGDPVTVLPGVAKAAAARFEKLGVTTVGDAARLFPRRFNDFTNVLRIADVRPSATPVTIVGTVLSARQQRFGRRLGGTEAVIHDDSGALRIVWFNQPYIARNLHEGGQLVVSGKVRAYRGRLQVDNPEYEPFDASEMSPGRLVPVYPATQGLGQRTIRRAVKAAVDAVALSLPDPVPAALAAEWGLPPIGETVRAYHYPASLDEAERARQRLALGEFLAIQSAVLIRRAEWQSGDPAPCLNLGDRLHPFLSSLGFALTRSQQSVLDDILRDIRGPYPMLRLLQGDVGSGKTVVAFAALLAAVRSGYQAALMAPTEILAEQHYRSLSRALGGEDGTVLEGVFAPPWFDRPLRVLMLTGSLTAAQKRQVRGDVANSGADIIIGTHALLETGVEMPRLGLAVIDEQHRFGVMQRARLRQKGRNPHLLVMTATPIPRTLALTVYGDLEVSTIDEMPPGRKPVKTFWVTPQRREEAYAAVRKRLDAGEQAFVICPLVEDSDVLDARSAEEEYERLRHGPFRDYRLELLHGRMPARHKDEVMQRFSRKEAGILVSTSVIEVGIDIPNATVIIIEGSERFGLSQLHQFRGRVGRSGLQAFCFLFSTDEDPGPDARDRLEAMVESTDGFKLAEVDLAMRGEGEAWGRVQSGANSMLRVARLTDRDLLYRAREMARGIIATDPFLQRPEHRALAAMTKPFLERAAEAN